MMPITKIMSPISEAIKADHVLVQAVQKMKNLDLAYLPVIDHGQVVGLLSNQDILERCSPNQVNLSKIQAKDFMRTGQLVCQENQSIEEIIQQMDQNQTDHLIVLSEFGQVVGLVSRDDIIANFPSLGFGPS